MERMERKLRTAMLKNIPLRDRLELAIPTRMLWQCVYSIQTAKDLNQEERTFCQSVLPILEKALLEPLGGLPLQKQAQLAVIINDASNWAIQVYVGRSVPSVFMIILHWLKQILDAEYLILDEDSLVKQALILISEELIKCPTLAALNKSAEKNSRRLLTRFQSLGLFKLAPSMD